MEIAVAVEQDAHEDVRYGLISAMEAQNLVVEFTVAAEPIPQGSKTKTRWGVREDNPRTRPWRATVSADASAAMAGREPVVGPVLLEVHFFFGRPKSHYGSGRNAAALKPSAPVYHAVKPDLDKLIRAIGDGMAKIVVRDDTQFARVIATKRYGTPRAEITVRHLTGDTAVPTTERTEP